MAVTTDDLLVNVSVNTSKAAASLESLTKELGDLRQSLNKTNQATEESAKSLTSSGAAMLKLSGVINVAKEAFALLEGSVGKAIRAFEEADTVQMKLKASLASVGAYSSKAVAGWEAYAAQVQNASTIDDDAVLALVAKAKAMGRSDDQTKQMIGTANDLAAIFDGDVNSAFMALSGTLNGVVSRDLMKLDDRTKGLSETQLKNGEAVKLLSEKYKGFAGVLVNSIEGAKKQSENALGNLFEEIGARLNDIFDFKTLYQNSRDLFNSLIGWLKELQPVAQDIGFAFKAMSEAIAKIDFAELAANSQVLIVALGGIAAVNLAPFVVAVGAAAAEFVAMAVAIGTVLAALDIVFRNLDKLPQVADLFTAAFLGAFSKITEGLLSLIREILMQMAGLATKIGEAFPGTKLAGIAADASLALGKAVGSMSEEVENQVKFTESMFKDLEEASKGLDLGLAGALKSQLDNLIKNFTSAYSKLKKDNKLDGGPQNKTPMAQAAQVKADLPQLFSEKEVALISQMFGTGAGSFATAASSMAAVPLGMIAAANIILDAVLKIIKIIPEILNKIGDVFQGLAELPQKIQEAFQHIFDAFLNLTRNIWKNIKEAAFKLMDGMTKFAEELPKAIIEAMKEFPDLMTKIVDKLPDTFGRIGESIAENFPAIAEAFIKSIIANLPKLIVTFAKMYVMIWVKLIQGILKGLRDGFKNLFGGKKMKLDVDTKGLEKSFKGLGRTLSGEASKLFDVKDLASGKAARDAAQKLEDLIDQAKKAGKSIWDYFIQALKDGWDWLKKLGGKIWEGLKEYAGEIWEFFKGLGLKIWDGLRGAAGEITAWFKEKGGAIWSGLKDMAGEITEWFKTQGGAIWNGFVTFLKDPGEWFSSMGGKIWIGLTTFLKDPGEWFRNMGGNIWTGVSNGITNAYDKIRGVGSDIWAGAMDSIQNWPNTIAGVGRSIWDGAMERIKSWPNTIADVGSDIWDGAIERIKSWPNTIANVGAKMWDGFVQALKDGWDWIKEKFAGLFPSGGGGGGGGVLGIGLAKGGPVYAATGLMVPHGTDTVPAMLSPGEFVMSKGAVQSLGLGAMKAINSGQMPQGNTNVVVNLDVKTTEALDENFIRNRLVPRIKDELRRASLDGAFILSKNGVRTT